MILFCCASEVGPIEIKYIYIYYYYCVPFLFMFILAFVLFRVLSTLLNVAHPSANAPLDLRKEIHSLYHSPTKVHVSVYTFSMVFPSTATMDVMAFSLSITLVLLRFMLRPTGLLARCMSVSMLSSSSGDLGTRTIYQRQRSSVTGVHHLC